MRTARISDLGRGHPRAEFVPKLRVESFHRSDSEGCTIVIIERPSPDRFSTGPLYICALYAHAGWPPPESSCSIEPITACLLHQEPPRLGSRLEFWRTTQMGKIVGWCMWCDHTYSEYDSQIENLHFANHCPGAPEQLRQSARQRVVKH